MKKIIAVLMALLAPASAWASDVTGTQNYLGTITAVAPGYYGHAGINLPSGWSCRGRSVVLLLTSNPRYADILAIMITAQSTHQSVKLHTPAATADYSGFCTIEEASLGDLVVW